MLKLKGEMRGAKEMKDEAGERDREVSNLNSKLLSLQVDIKNLHDVCKRQGKTLQENQLCVEETMMNSSHNKKQTLAFEKSQMEFEPSKQCHLRQLQQLKKKLLALQQELEFRTEELQTSYCSLLQYQSLLEKQTSDLVLLHHHCKLKEDEVILYEEEMGNHNENTGEKLHLAQEQLALAGDKIVSLERSLSLYRDKYQTSLSNIELLECQVKMLEGELSGIVSQDPENKGDHSKVRIYTSSCMIQEHQETLKRLSEVWQKVSEQDDLIQELRNKLACSNALVLEREEALIKLQADFASYTATHRHPPSSSEDCEDIKKILKHLQEQKDSQCLHVEEYQNLVKDLRMELEAVSEQKKNIMKDMMKLELDLHGLREETSAHMERKDKEVVILQRRLQELQIQFTETQKLGLKKDKLLQEKDEMLHELEKELAQVQNSLMKKEMELEKQQRMTTELEITIQELKQDKSRAECGTLRAEIQKLKDSLEETQQQQKLAAQQAAQYKEEILLAKNNLEDAQRKLQSYTFLEKQKTETIQELQRELQKLQKDSLIAGEELAPNRKRIEELTSELSEARRKLEISEKEKRQFQKTTAEQDMKLNELLEHLKILQHQHREQASAKTSLTEELQEVTRLLEEKREQLKKSKEQEKLLELELETFQQEEKKKEKMTKESLRMLEEENENVKAQLMQCSTQLDSSLSKQNASQQVIQELNNELVLQKEALESLQIQLDKAVQKEKQYIQTMVSKEAYEELSRKSAACQDDLTQTLEKLNHTTSETKSLHRSLAQAQERKVQLEDEIIAYEERMKKLNMELKKLQGFQQQSELEVHAFDKKLEEMSNQVLQWQKQHQSDLKMLAAKEEQLRAFQEEMTALKDNLLADEKEPCCLPQRSAPKESCRIRRENDQIMSNMEQWAKEQNHLHNVMVHLQQENKKLKTEIEEKKLKTGHPRLYTKALGPSKTEPIQKGKVCATLGWRGTAQDMSQRMDITKFVGIPHCSDSMLPQKEEATPQLSCPAMRPVLEESSQFLLKSRLSFPHCSLRFLILLEISTLP
ncbi:polyamine-modulated factor 1-binding protein 1 isoform X2 [Canis lupus baileyi]|uniref:polyamine-modulated factor 1-binding protein 1 isoform X2 n=1 Tax=Canis lupus familiaris TaxID=9615 RepID=UPI0003ADCAA2|nr:polyamine-modulated factor 1-binding protein 1 isoform X2 [Canis lupus familiaris]XP_038394391.1 polyamine-modulated factor 1-binding protein 1 isoform X2 [Canis lupus familiaris]XP_038523115.1 polyamine-modulated factor 1-binding protein 1 isoform X2 [Canis lupus familiaris]|eukprot:XP_005620813.1 polyamine-modulated factor 1-binding protein 1 isoform X2 [Canis lupus familiaris]